MLKLIFALLFGGFVDEPQSIPPPLLPCAPGQVQDYVRNTCTDRYTPPARVRSPVINRTGARPTAVEP